MPDHCTHRDVLPMAGKEGFSADSWCTDCALYKAKRMPRKREEPSQQQETTTGDSGTNGLGSTPRRTLRRLARRRADRRRLTPLHRVGPHRLAVGRRVHQFPDRRQPPQWLGPVWNVGERVQSFTHPLWLALCTAAFGITGNVYYTAIALCVFVTLGFIFILVTRVAVSSRHLLVCFAVLLSSKAFIDYSTSGLENPLTHLLLLVFLWGWWCLRDDARRLALLSLVAALCMLNRLDLILILAPPLALASWRLGVQAIRPVIVGTLPIVLWLAFATFYYGTPFPNTAYAKLSTALTTDIRLARGVDYFLRTLVFDPVTLPAIAVGLACARVVATPHRLVDRRRTAALFRLHSLYWR